MDPPSLAALPEELVLEVAVRAPLAPLRRALRFDVRVAASMRLQRWWLLCRDRLLQPAGGSPRLSVGDRVIVRGHRGPRRFATIAAIPAHGGCKVRLTDRITYVNVPLQLVRKLGAWADGPWGESIGREAALASATAARGAAMDAAAAAMAAARSSDASPAVTALAAAAASAASTAAAAATAAAVATAGSTAMDTVTGTRMEEAESLIQVVRAIQEAASSAVVDSQAARAPASASGSSRLACRAATAASEAAGEAQAATSAATAPNLAPSSRV